MANDLSPGGLSGYFDITDFFAGSTRAYGVFEDRFGRPRRRFMIDIEGRWDGDTFLLEERLHYADGEFDQRTWRVVKERDGRFVATTPDCVNGAIGESGADFWRMLYCFRVRLGKRVTTVSFDDRVYRCGPTTAVNRATLRKCGLRLGDVIINYEKIASPRPSHPERLAAVSA